MKFKLLLLSAVWMCVTALCFAAPKSEAEQKKIIDSLKWQTEGTISLENGAAAFKLEKGYRYLDSNDANKVLSDLWGNPPSKTLGMVFPPEQANSESSWAVIIEGFEADGYVKDEDADKLDPAKLLKEMQDAQAEANESRKEHGYRELELVGWATPPRYDKEAKKIFWALDIKTVGSNQHTLNYYVRILGRRGYLVLNIIGELNQVKQIEAATPQVLAMVDFNEGHRYADFDEKTDKVAAYGLAGLILGAAGLKTAAKLGFLALLLKKFGALILVFKKGIFLLLVPVIWIFNKIKQLFTGEKPDSQENPPTS